MKEPANKMNTPRGDWTYTQPETGMPFRSMHPRSLENQVFAHRLSLPDLNLDVSGGWQVRLWNDVCRQNEHLDCKEVGDPGRWANLADAWNWARSMLDWRSTGFSTVTPEEANRRADICVTCPHNKTVAGCFGCHGVGEIMDSISGGLRTKNHDRLQQCAVCHGCMLGPKVWLPREVIHAESYQDQLPSFCWQKGSSLSK